MNAKALITGFSLFVTSSSVAFGAPLYVTTSHMASGTSIVSQAETKPSRKEADQLLREARAAMQEGRVDVARKKLAQVEKLGVSYKGLLQRFGDTPEKLRADLQKLGESAGDGLPVPQNQNPVSLPQPQRLNAATLDGSKPISANLSEPNGMPMAGLQFDGSPAAVTQKAPQLKESPKKIQAKQLIAQSMIALRKGDLTTAEKFAQQAHGLRVADGEYAPNEQRPWMLLLEIDRAKRRSGAGIAQAVGQPSNQFGNHTLQQQTGVVQASALQPIEAAEGGVDNGVITEGVPPQPLTTPGANPFTNDPVAPAVAQTISQGVELMKEGEAALKQRDLKAAREKFAAAWKYERELDPASRQRLQDHLQLLQSKPAEIAEPEKLTNGEQAIVRRFVNEISREQAAADRALTQNPKGVWDRLTDLKTRVEDAEIPGSARQQLIGRIDRSIQRTEDYISRNRAKISADEKNKEVIAQIDRQRHHRRTVDEKLAKLVDEFNTLMDQQRYAEAMVRANQAKELEPNNPTVESMIWKSRFAERLAVELSIRDRLSQRVEVAMRDVSSASLPWDESNLLEFPEQGSVKYWEDLTRRRLKRVEGQQDSYSETELEIQRALREKVRVSFDNEPLGQVLQTLGNYAGVTIYMDPTGMGVQAVTSDMPVTIDLNQEIKLMSALNLILEPFGLTYVIQDEVLKITSEEIRDQKTSVQTYDVADLIVPIPNFPGGYDSGMAGGLREAFNTQRPGQPLSSWNGGGATPPGVPPMTNNQNLSNGKVYAQLDSPGAMQGQNGAIPGFGPGGAGGAAQADFDTLIELITATISPNSWEDVGGEGSIQGFPTNLSLVVSNTQEVHEQIADLLDQLRKLQDLQVTIEVRFITLNDNFFERIGVDFDFDIDDNVSNLPAGDTDSGPSVTIGLDPQGNPTADLDLAFSQDSFGASTPSFGGFDAGTAANFGFAILSDIEAFFLIQAAQGDSRTNVLQAPKVTLFNGQQATVSDQSQRPFVTSVTPVVGDFAAAQQPIILVLNEGTQLTVQAVVSPDRRFVRLTLVPFFSEIGEVEEFTFEGRRQSSTGTAVVDPTDDAATVQDNADDFVEGTTVQLPQFAFTSVSTTVSVPDGGTILLGGIKRLSEGRNERGIPMLGKIPYVNRLFKNVGIGRTTQSLMMMVTPRIIIQEEEEERLGISLP